MILKESGYMYDLLIEYRYLPGKKQLLADTLSRASLEEMPPEDNKLQVNIAVSITEAKYAQLQQSAANELHELYSIQIGLPEQNKKSHTVSGSFGAQVMNWQYLMEQSTCTGGERIVVLPIMRAAMLKIIHETCTSQ